MPFLPFDKIGGFSFNGGVTLYYPLKDVEKLNQAVVCCARCNTAAFILPRYTKGIDFTQDSFKKSEWVAPIPRPRGNEKVKCPTCGLLWGLSFAHINFKLKEGAPNG